MKGLVFYFGFILSKLLYVLIWKKKLKIFNELCVDW